MAGWKTWKFAGCKQNQTEESSRPRSAVHLLLLLLTSLFIVSCGSTEGATGGASGRSPTTTGRFIDDPVQGLAYTCSSGSSGITNGKSLLLL